MAMEKFEDQVVPALDYIETFYAEEVPTLPVLHWTDVAVLLEEEISVNILDYMDDNMMDDIMDIYMDIYLH
jgi:hypothetical protein